MASAFDRFAQNFFGHSLGIDVGRVEHVQA